MKMEKRYHGYLALPRQSNLLCQQLGYKLFGFYLSLVMEAEWSRKNPNFGRVIKNQIQLANALRADQSAISRNLQKLGRYKYCILRHSNGIYLGYFPLFLSDVASKIHSKDYANLHELYADMHRINAELQELYVNTHNSRYQNTSQRLYISSNVQDSFSSGGDMEIDIDEVDKGMKKMLREGGKNE